jgi:uncharacterized RDD family membrane protein YckC
MNQPNSSNDWAQSPNPYAAPASFIEDDFGGRENLWGGRDLATRGSRLAASCLDGICGSVVALPIIISMFSAGAGARMADQVFSLSGLVTLVLGLALVVYNLMRLSSHGQTIGKQMVGIQIIRSDLQTPVGLGRILGLRILPITLLSFIPFIGSLIQLIDPLLIFQGSQQCIHDMIADTNVVVYEG